MGLENQRSSVFDQGIHPELLTALRERSPLRGAWSLLLLLLLVTEEVSKELELG